MDNTLSAPLLSGLGFIEQQQLQRLNFRVPVVSLSAMTLILKNPSDDSVRISRFWTQVF